MSALRNGGPTDYVVITIVSNDVPDGLVWDHRAAFARIAPGVDHRYVAMRTDHGEAMDRAVRSHLDRERVVFLEIDAMFESRDAIERLVSDSASGIAGILQAANHIGREPYIGPGCMAVDPRLACRASAVATDRGDVAAAWSRGVDLSGAACRKPLWAEVPLWAADVDGVYHTFGLYTQYEGGIWHRFQGRDRYGHAELRERLRAVGVKPHIAVVTATTGRPSLEACVESVKAQASDRFDVTHWVIGDGAPLPDHVRDVSERGYSLRVVRWPEPSGATGFYGHRIYCAASQLIAAPYVAFLDDDNEMLEGHLDTMYAALTDKAWSYCGRFLRCGERVAPDVTEVVVDGEPLFVDTSCYLMRRWVAVRYGGALYGGWGADRVFYEHVKRFPHACTGKRTIMYQVRT